MFKVGSWEFVFRRWWIVVRGSWLGVRGGVGGWHVVVADGGWLWLVDGLWPATGVCVGGGSFLACGEE